ncbi:hypothetical protein DEU56DRAFT_925546 [Suillus clintonianus]|uniref:uncharacterized protein n=1 Tax=Suillus clintonianus TaxID=1904413 RepID=UPI001B862160|nr:uncharacterized protein DEU56DRAFT_925546 [Suillus clintonianus]KAG2122745.1 hypothetical protein DEU56DRAFT_925546 [Suillus clintonianus]
MPDSEWNIKGTRVERAHGIDVNWFRGIKHFVMVRQAKLFYNKTRTKKWTRACCPPQAINWWVNSTNTSLFSSMPEPQSRTVPTDPRETQTSLLQGLGQRFERYKNCDTTTAGLATDMNPVTAQAYEISSLFIEPNQRTREVCLADYANTETGQMVPVTRLSIASGPFQVITSWSTCDNAGELRAELDLREAHGYPQMRHVSSPIGRK